MRLLGLGIAVLGFSLPVFAEEAPADPSRDQWSGNADIGYSASDGNSDTENLNFAATTEYVKALWTHGLRLNAVREDDDGTTQAERYEAGYKVEYAVSEVSYLFGNLAYERDEFGGVFQRTSQTLGYGRKLLNTEVHSLEAEIGLGARQSELQDGTEEEEGIVRLGAAYERILSDSATVNQDLIIEAGNSNTYLESISAMKLRINGNLYAKLAYTVKHNDTVPVGTEETDTYTTVSLSYQFGQH